MTVFHNDPQASQFELASKRIYIHQDVEPCCDGTNHILIPECEFELAVCKPVSRSYFTMAHMCPCGAVTTDLGRTWEQPIWGMVPVVVREERVSTVTKVNLNDDYDNSLAETQFSGFLARLGVAAVVSAVMFISVVLMGLPTSAIEKQWLLTLLAPHVWFWTKVRAPSWGAALVRIACATPGFMLHLALILLATIVSFDLMLGRMVLNLKIWLKALPKVLFNLAAEVLLYILLISYFIVMVVWEVNVNIWNGRPRVLRANPHGYAFALLIVITMLVAGIR